MKLPIGTRTRKIVAIVIGTSLFVSLLLNLRVFNFFLVEDSLEAYAINYMSNFSGRRSFDSKVKIIVIPEKQQSGEAPWGDIELKHREFFQQLITHMTAAHAKVLAFDMAFDSKSPEVDKRFGEAVAKARENGLTVIVGVDNCIDGKLDPEIPPAFNQPNWGLIQVGSYQGKEIANQPIRALKLADTDGDNAELVPSFPLRVVMDSQSLAPELQVEWNRLLLYSDQTRHQLSQIVPLERGRYIFLDQASQKDLNQATVYAQRVYEDFKDPGALPKYENAIVLVGYEMGDRRPIQAGGTRLGVELHATAVSNILRRVYVYRLYLIFSYLIILVMALLALLMETPIGKKLKCTIPYEIPFIKIKPPIPIGLLILAAIYLAVAISIFMLWRIYLDVPYHLAALALSYALMWLIFTKLAPQPQPKDSLTNL